MAIGRSAACERLVGDDARVAVAQPARGRRRPATHAEPWLSRDVSAASISEVSTWRPAPAAALQRGEDADRGEQPADEVDHRGAGLRGRPVRLAGDVHQPADRLGEEVVAGQLAVLGAERGHRAGHELRVAAARSVSPSSPQRAISPGRKLSTSTSARRASARASSRSPGSARSSATRALVAVQAEVVGRVLAPPRRAPASACRRRRPGRSTLTTSAPRSPSSMVAYGPASTREKSATRRPSRPMATAPVVRLRTLVVSDLHIGSGAASRPAAPARAARAADRRARATSTGSSSSATRSSCARCRSTRPPSIAGPFLADAGRGARRRTARSCSPAATTTTSCWRAGSTQHLQPSRRLLGPGGAHRARDGRPDRRAPRRRGARPPRLLVRLPGLWLRDDVYAIHGHYLDLHSTTPTIERLAAGAMARCGRAAARGRRRARRLRGGARARCTRGCTRSRSARDHAAVARAAPRSSVRAWVALAGDGRRERPVRARRARRGPARRGRRPQPRRPRAASTASCPARRCAAAACAGIARGAARGSASTRRTSSSATPTGPGPWPRDDPAEWRTPRRHAARSTPAAGSTSATSSRREPAPSPYWPGTAVVRRRRRPAAARAPARRRPGGAPGAATPGVKQVAWHVTPSPTSQLEHARGVVRVLEQRVAPRPSTATSPVRPRTVAGALEHRPHAAGLVRAARRRPAGPRSAPAAARPRRPRGGRGSTSGRARCRAAPGSRARSPRRRPRRSAASTARPSGVPQVARGPALVAVEVPDLQPRVDHDGVLDARAARRRARRLRVARAGEAAGVDADHPQPVGRVARVPGLEVGQRPQRVDAAEVPELDEHRPAALLVHAQRGDVDPRQPPGNGGAGMACSGARMRRRR